MAYDKKTLKRDGSGITPVPQHFNPIADDYEPIYGRNNAGRVELYGPDGNPISTDDSNKLAVRATEIESLLNDIKGKDFATQTTLAAILAKLIAAPATEAKQDTLISHVDGVEAALATLLTKAGFDAKADISLTALRDALRGTGSKTLTDLANALVPLATAAKQDTLAGLVSTAANQTALQNLIGSLAAAAVTDPTASATLIQLLKGLLKQLQGGGTGAAPVQLSGRIVEIGGVTFAVSGGDTLRGKAADKPDAVAAHAVIPYCYYFSVDTGIVEVTDGTDWVVI